MNASVHFLNVGWGDAHFIRLPSGALTLIDGGDGSLAEGRDHPLRWMERRGLRRLDAMIVTHLHEDHLNGLLDVVRSVEVALAILPYGLPERAVRFRPELEREASELTRRVCGILETYRELIRLLEARGTEIRWRSRHASAESSVVWEEHGFRLEHLYPWQDDPLPALEVLHSVFDADGRPEEERLAELAGFFDKSNDDSSVYRLTADGDETVGVLFGGDLMEGGWTRLARRSRLASRIWKAPHHGLEDSFQAWLLELVRPEACVIPICAERAEPLAERWNGMLRGSGSRLCLTGSVPPGESLLLARGRIHAEIGG
ncbi:ComEC/Rec2 family competence protein [Paenibacillus pasadenensis]|uniref:DNA internalization-related competence protein ComEC/Rec2 n=1 Tax=Paenibacillus pasadenensis TaxID=217090 RepID=A0A2N5N249_9BACL|nr:MULTISPECIES: MBL fold metallo-hydrolase [Paenibacillus]PLT44399.1 DNA internalization-related competence protein ComEC/Rec2 [Paenibacillus pasadenensis]QGG54887.1 hypothetical protein GE073_04320 [Paenibacillus sp. B01]